MLSHSFSKAQIAALIATAVDFSCLIILVELFSLWYPYATAIAALSGAITNFLLGRHWSFVATGDHWKQQAIRYGWVSLGSLMLNTMMVYGITEMMGVQYVVSKIVASVIIGIAFNYPLHRYYVFKTKTAP